MVSINLNENGDPDGGMWSAVHKPNALSGEDERRTLSFVADGRKLDEVKERYGLSKSYRRNYPPGKVDISSMLRECMTARYGVREPTITK